jgi:hypothetical protein
VAVSHGFGCSASLPTDCLPHGSVIPIPCGGLASSPEARAECGKAARSDPWRGSWATRIPTPTIVELQVTLSLEEERHRTGHGGNGRQKPEPAGRRGPRSGSDRLTLTGASDTPRRWKPVGCRRWRLVTAEERKTGSWVKKDCAPVLGGAPPTDEAAGLMHGTRCNRKLLSRTGGSANKSIVMPEHPARNCKR